MAVSLPSPRIIFADIQEINEFRAEFVYNFFQPDERTNDSGLTAPQFVQTRPTETFDANFVESDKFNRFTSRYIKLTWKPLVETKTAIPVKTLRIVDNLSKIYNEQDLLGERYTALAVQDTYVGEKVKFIIEKFIAQKKKLEFPGVTTGSLKSPMDISKELQTETSKEVEGALLMESLGDIETYGYMFENKKSKEKVQNTSLFKEVQKNKQYMSINNKFYGTILGTAEKDGVSFIRDEGNELLDEARQIESEAKSKNNSNLLDGTEYDVEITDFVHFRYINTSGYNPVRQIVGYVIDKKETTLDGREIEHAPVIVEAANINTTIDYRIKYGSTYTYTIRAIAYVESQAVDIESEDVVAVSYLISSKPSHIERVKCFEEVPPPPPVDFNVRWDLEKGGILLTWNFPVNSQRDIKQWQIFRRASIHESFELLRVMNFDDSVLPGPDKPDQAEYPTPDLIHYSLNPQNYFLDRDFNKKSRYIYTVCSVDAHGYSSNYALQIECTFDKYENRINKKIISFSGAPKVYPNMYLNSDTFVDTIRDSGHKKLDILFDPEYLKIIDSENNDLKLLATTEDSFYRMNLINVDLQEQKTIEIKVLDKRITIEKTKQETLVQNRIRRFGKFRRQTARA